MREVISWLSQKEIDEIYTSNYWNDIEEERKKEWWIIDGNYDKCINYLKKSNLLDEYYLSEKFICEFGGGLRILDLAAGIGWTSALISKLKNVAEVHAVEISKHRISELFEHSIKMMGGIEEKIYRYIGSFYNLQIANQSIDLIYLSQAFHHADRPIYLLLECDRVLKKNGRIILVGEPKIGFIDILKKIIKNLIIRKKIISNFHELFPPDPLLGDHYYRKSDYYFMFKAMGYKVKDITFANKKIIYVADKYN